MEEDVYCQVMQVIDYLRTMPDDDAIHYIDRLYKNLVISYRQQLSSQPTPDTLIHLAAAAVLFLASCLLTLTAQPGALKYALALQMNIDDADFSNTRMLLHQASEAFKTHMDRPTKTQWTQYYLSDSSVCRQIQEILKKVRDFNYVNMDALEEYIANINHQMTYESFMNDFRIAAETDAPTLADFLHRYEKLGILNFHHDTKRTIHDKLQAYFPTMAKYTYTNFAAAF